jgi:hypothetical protein
MIPPIKIHFLLLIFILIFILATKIFSLPLTKVVNLPEAGRSSRMTSDLSFLLKSVSFSGGLLMERTISLIWQRNSLYLLLLQLA